MIDELHQIKDDIVTRLDRIKSIKSFEVFIHHLKQTIEEYGTIKSVNGLSSTGLAIRVISSQNGFGFFTGTVSQASKLLDIISEKANRLSSIEERDFAPLRPNRVAIPKISFQAFDEKFNHEILEVDDKFESKVEKTEEIKLITNSYSEETWEIQRGLFVSKSFEKSKSVKINGKFNLGKDLRDFESKIMTFSRHKGFMKEKPQTKVTDNYDHFILSPEIFGKIVAKILLETDFRMSNEIFSERTNIYEDPLKPYSYTSTTIDDEGIKTYPMRILDNGEVIAKEDELREYIQYGGNAYRYKLNRFPPHSFEFPPHPHYTNLVMDTGKLRFEDIISSVDNLGLIEKGGIQIIQRREKADLLIRIHQGELYENQAVTKNISSGTLLIDLKSIFQDSESTRNLQGVYHSKYYLTSHTGWLLISADKVKIIR